MTAPASSYALSVKPDPKPAPVSTNTSCPALFNETMPDGVIATLFSLFLSSFGIPILIAFPPFKTIFYFFSYFKTIYYIYNILTFNSFSNIEQSAKPFHPGKCLTYLPIFYKRIREKVVCFFYNYFVKEE